MSVNRFRFVLFSSLIIVGSILWSIGEARAITFKFATVIPEGVSGWAQLQNSVVEIQKRTKGAVSIKLYGGGVAGDEMDVLRKMRVNRIHMAQFSGYGLDSKGTVRRSSAKSWPKLFVKIRNSRYTKLRCCCKRVAVDQSFGQLQAITPT